MSDSEVEPSAELAENRSVMVASSSSKTRKILKPVSPAAKARGRPAQAWTELFLTEDIVTKDWRRTGTRKLKDGSSVTSYKCAISGTKCNARIKKVVSDKELGYFSNGKEHSNHPIEGEDDELEAQSENEAPTPTRRRRKVEDSDDSDNDDRDGRAIKEGMSNMVNKYVKNKKRLRIQEDEDDDVTDVDIDANSDDEKSLKKRRKSESSKDKKRESSGREKKRKSAKIKLVVPMP